MTQPGWGSQLSVIRYGGLIEGKPALILSTPAGVGSYRRDGRVKIGLITDTGKEGIEKYTVDWKYDYSVDSKNVGFAYSCLTELPNHQIGLIYEKYDSYNPAELHSQDIMKYEELSLSNLMGKEVVEIIPQAEGKGTVSQRNTVEKGSTITIEAYPEEGYQFVHWTDEKGNPVSEQKTYTFEATEKAVLKAVFEKMGEEADKSLLKFAMQYAEEQMADERYPDVIPAVRKAYEKAYKDAKEVYENPAATEAEVENAYWTLIEAGQKLNWYKGDITNLQVAYDLYAGRDLSIYTEGTRKALEEALTEAKEILDLGENAVKDLVDAALEKLNAAIGKLELISANKTKLEELVKEAKQYEAKIDEYTEETAKTFTEMLADARDVLSKEAVSQTTIDSAYVALQQAIFELRLIPNKDKLEALINKVENTDLSGYTAESVAVLKTALFEAKAVMADSKADQKAVDKAVQVLQEKFDGLVAVGEETKAEKDALKDLIDKTEKMDLKSYTAETVLAVRNALKEAKAVYDDKDATQQEVDAVLAKLQKAVDGLKKADAAKPTDKDQGTGNTNKADKNQGTSDTKPAKTGDTALPIGWAALGMTAMLAAVFRFLARRKNTK